MIIGVFWAGLLGAIAYVVVTRRHRTPREITPIAQAPDAIEIFLRAKVTGEMPLRAPFTGRACTYYWIDIRIKTFNKKRRWHKDDGRPFTIADDTGRATVPLGRFLVPHDAFFVGRASRLAPRTRTVLQTLGVEVPDVAEIWIYEGSLGDGDAVDVCGAGMRRVSADDAGERGFRDRPTGILELGGDVEVVADRRPLVTLE